VVKKKEVKKNKRQRWNSYTSLRSTGQGKIGEFGGEKGKIKR
jgi:hypothetical protein